LSHQLASINFEELSFSDQVINLMSTFETENLQFNVENLFDINWKNINNSIKRNLYLIIRESIINTVKHANATKINMVFKKYKKSIDLLINDNGKGFDPNKNYEGTGLRNIKTRIKELNGQIDIDSIPNKGTTLRTSIILS
jgi:signal transduction histidine kinase